MNGSSTHADVLVIGAGASGGTAAAYLAKHGFDVVCLEQGDWVRRDEYLGASPEWELSAGKVWNPDPNRRQNVSDYPVNVEESDISPLMFNGVGGSTILYAGHWMRLTRSDFMVKTLDGVGDDWPITYEDLAPYYDRVARAFGVSGLAGDPVYPEDLDYPHGPLPIGDIGMRAAQGLDKLGWHWWPGSNAMSGRKHGHQQACVRRGTCLTGCPEGAKGSTDITHWLDAIKDGARLETGARVLEITVDAQGRATGATWIDRDGQKHHQSAAVVILAANGIGTPRILLSSRSNLFPDGLANSSGLVGRRLMMHPAAAVDGTYDDPLESWLGPAGQPIYSMQFYDTQPDQNYVRGSKWNVMPGGGPLGMRSGYGTGSLNDMWGENFHRNNLRTVGHTFEWGICAEDLPEEHNRVVLDDTLTDSSGFAAPKIQYRMSENTKRLIEHHTALMFQAHEASGASEISVSPGVGQVGFHLLGTARMGTDPSNSVVNEFNRTHDVSNLYIIDGSVFVTSGGVNPTATITALALRCAEHIVNNASDQVVSK